VGRLTPDGNHLNLQLSCKGFSTRDAVLPIFSVSEVIDDGLSAVRDGFVTPPGIAAWLLQLAVFTKPGVAISMLASSYYLFTTLPEEKSWLAIAAPVYLLPLAFLGVICHFLHVFTSLATEWLIALIIREPNPRNLIHKFLFFMISLPVFVLMAFIFGGDSDPTCGGRYCD